MHNIANQIQICLNIYLTPAITTKHSNNQLEMSL